VGAFRNPLKPGWSRPWVFRASPAAWPVDSTPFPSQRWSGSPDSWVRLRVIRVKSRREQERTNFKFEYSKTYRAIPEDRKAQSCSYSETVPDPVHAYIDMYMYIYTKPYTHQCIYTLMISMYVPCAWREHVHVHTRRYTLKFSRPLGSSRIWTSKCRCVSFLGHSSSRLPSSSS